MNRRALLKMLATAGLAPFAAGFAGRVEAGTTAAFYLVTDRPDADLVALRRVAGTRPLAGFRTSIVPMASAPQDLALRRGSVLVDPSRSGAVPPALAAFVAAVRARLKPGNVLLSIEPPSSGQEGVAVIEQDGRVIEQIVLDHDYAYIDVPGAAGRTVFKIQDGRLTVTEASCRHKLCSKLGPQTHGRIICAPNRLVVNLPGFGAGLDAVTG